MLLREAEQVLRQNLHNSKEYPSDNDFLKAPVNTSPTKFILPLEDPDDFSKSSPSPIENSRADSGSYYINNSFSSSREFGKKVSEQNEEDKRRFEHLKKEKKDILAVISRIKRQMAEIEIQEEELQREVTKKQ